MPAHLRIGGTFGLHSRPDSHLSGKKRVGTRAKVVRFPHCVALAKRCLLCFWVSCLIVGFIGVFSPLSKPGSLSYFACWFGFNFQVLCFCSGGLPPGTTTSTTESIFEVCLQCARTGNSSFSVLHSLSLYCSV